MSLRQLLLHTPADDVVGIVVVLKSDELSTRLSAVRSDVLVFGMWGQVQTGFPLLVLVWLVAADEAVHADAHHIPAAGTLAYT